MRGCPDPIKRITEVSYFDETNQARVYVDGKRKTVPFAMPHLKTRKTYASATIDDGQTLVIGSQMDEPSGGTEKQRGTGKRLLAIITPTLIDLAQEPLQAEGKLLSK
jgi:hypothetical protein